ncbi:MAG: PAS domain S-box protein [Acidobacteria bacterium]|nr:PAS domain S-box protein [Acidobacteriota bacterium]
MTPLHLRLQKFAFAAGTTAIFVSVAVLIGWGANIPWLTNLSPRFVTMKPLTAVCFILSGGSLCLLMFRSPGTVVQSRVARLLALLVLFVGVSCIVEFSAGVDFQFETVLFPDTLQATGNAAPGRLALASGVAFALLGLALLCLDFETDRSARLAQLLSLCTADLAMLHLLAYLFDFEDQYRTFDGNSMSLHTAGLFFVLGTGVFAARPNRGLAAVFNAQGIAGRMARSLLPSAVVLMTVIACVQLFFQRSGYYGTGLGLAIFTSANITLFALMLFWASRSLNASIEQLEIASRDLARSNDVSIRTNARLASIIESSDDAIISKSLDGTITSWNPGAERIFGYSASEVLGQSIHILIPPDRLSEEVDILRRIAAGQSIRHFESTRLRKDGAHILVSVTISPLRDPSGAIVGASKIARDITENRRIRNSVAQHEARLAAIIGAAMDAVITVNADQRITMFNPAAESMFGCKTSVALGSSLDRFIPHRFRAEHFDHIRNFGQTNTTRRRMGRLNSVFGVRSNGAEFPVEASISQTEVDGEKLYTVILRDVTDRRLADEEFRQQAALLDLAPVIVRDLENRIILWTRGAQQLYGFSREEALGRNSHELLQTEFPVSLAHIAQAFHRDGAWEGELRHRTRDGRTVFVASQWVLHYDASGKPARILEINTDLTELKRVQTSQMRSRKLESLGTLAGGVAHDFNNILSAINGNARIALEDLPLHHPVRPYLTEISKAGARATDLVRRILAFSRPQESKCDPTSIQPVVEEALSLVRATLPASIQIEFKSSGRLPPVAIDPSQLHQIIVNLATNASHAIGDRPGLITVRLTARSLNADDCQGTPGLHEGRYVCLTLSDDGCGMDRATLDRIFDPFFTTKPVGQGTGLGLSVVHGIVSGCDGAISVYSQPGKGTSFLLYFPASEPSGSDVAPLPAQPDHKATHHENLLFIDDEEALVMLGTRFLERLGYRVTGHVDAISAIAEFRADPSRFAAVVTDLSMPKINGFEVARQILSIRPGIPIVLASGYVRPEDEQQAASIGIRRVLLKPSTIDVLAQTLDEILASVETPSES